jgi:cytoskeletal protein CcmA (bactofilin family)
MKTRLLLCLALSAAASARLSSQNVAVTVDSSAVRVWDDSDADNYDGSDFDRDEARRRTREARDKEREIREWEAREKEKALQERLRGLEPPERALRFKVRNMDSLLMGLDTLLKHLPIPDEIQIDGKGFRWSAPGGRQNIKIIPPPKITEREGILKFGEDAVIGRTECVLGDVVVFDGDATVYGEVQGGVVTVKGDVRLASTARVEGDVVCIWGNAEVEEGAATGKTTVFNFGRMFGKFPGKMPTTGWMILVDVFRIFLLLVVTALIMAAFPAPTRSVSDKVQGQYARSLITGFVGILLIPVVFLVLLVTIIGIPVAILGLPLAVLAAFLVGGTAVGFRIGRIIQEQTGFRRDAPVVLACLGVLAIELILFVGKTFNFVNPVLGKTFFLVNALIFVCTWVAGFGAVLLTRFGRRPGTEAEMEKKRKKPAGD